MLSLQHLSTNTISPSNLREMLIDVESRLLSNFELTSNPRIDIWYFYKTLTSVTYLQDDEIRIILQIPLLNTNQKYDIYQVYNLPILKPLTGSHVLIKDSLETDAFMMSRDRTKFTFLSKSKYQTCKNHHLQLCNPETAFYQANVNKFCVIALFMRNKPDIKLFCKQMVVLNQKLPFAKHLSSGFWTVITNIPLTFTINCLSGASSDILVKPYFGILKLNNTCKASSDYLQLPIYFDKQTKYDRIDPLDTLLKVHNISEISFLNVSHDESVKFKSMTLPPHLANLREIPMQNFLHEVSMYEDTDFGTCKIDHVNWTIVALLVGATVVVMVIIIVWVLKHRMQCKAIDRSVGKHLANVHDLEGVNEKQSPSTAEDIEMSVVKNRQTVNDGDEEQQVFKRTNAMLAWTN